MDKKVISKRISRLKEVMEDLKKKEIRAKNNKVLAETLGYKRPGTISDYLNINEYTDEKFTVFVNTLKAYFGVNPAFVLDGTGGKFLENIELGNEDSKEISLNDAVLNYSKFVSVAMQSKLSPKAKDALKRIHDAMFDIAEDLNED